MVREWRHIKMLKRAGQGLSPGGIESTPPGSLALRCRACPQPDINLPRGWKNVARGKEYVSSHYINVLYADYDSRWLYMLIVAMDANFRLKNRLRKTTRSEPMLGLGMSYFVDDKPYTDYIKNYIDQEEVRLHYLFYEVMTNTARRFPHVWASKPSSTC